MVGSLATGAMLEGTIKMGFPARAMDLQDLWIPQEPHINVFKHGPAASSE